MPITANNLWKSTLMVSSRRKNYNSNPDTKLVRIVPYAGTGSVVFQYSTQGITPVTHDRAGRKLSRPILPKHTTYIMFSGLKVIKKESDTKPPAFDHFKCNYKGSDYFVQTPSLNKSPIYVRCSCYDFYYVFGWYNWRKKCIYGSRPKPYRRRTSDFKKYPPRNPRRLPGGCKHIWNILDYLKMDNFVLTYG